MEDILKNGSKWPLEEISKEDQASDLQEALIFGNHKGASSKPDLLKKLISKDVKCGYSLPIPLESVMQIKWLEMAPINIMAQNTIDKFGRVVPKDRLTHDQSWKWGVPVHPSTAEFEKSSSKRNNTVSASNES
jgi:hypothetical protein